MLKQRVASSSSSPAPAVVENSVALGITSNRFLRAAPALHLPQWLACPGLPPPLSSAASNDFDADSQLFDDVPDCVDAIFLSNQHSMWSLPALLQRFRIRCGGRIYATSATKHLGRCVRVFPLQPGSAHAILTRQSVFFSFCSVYFPLFFCFKYISFQTSSGRVSLAFGRRVRKNCYVILFAGRTRRLFPARKRQFFRRRHDSVRVFWFVFSFLSAVISIYM